MTRYQINDRVWYRVPATDTEPGAVGKGSVEEVTPAHDELPNTYSVLGDDGVTREVVEGGLKPVVVP